LYRDLARRHHLEILYRDLVKRTGPLPRDFVIESLNRDLTLRSLAGIFMIFCGDVLETLCTDSLAKRFCTAASTRTCQGDFAQDLLQISSQRELEESNLTSLLPKATLNEPHALQSFPPFPLES
jgi:hypothetical protein